MSRNKGTDRHWHTRWTGIVRARQYHARATAMGRAMQWHTKATYTGKPMQHTNTHQCVTKREAMAHLGYVKKELGNGIPGQQI